jgi:predicted metal-dependent phosphoesterase TrpH
MKIDLHCHSKYSYDTSFEPEELLGRAIQLGLDGVCFTEHYSMDASAPVERIQIPAGFYVFRGLEVSTNRGHMLVYGLEDDSWNIWSGNTYLDLNRVIERVHALAGICVPAHPFRGVESFGEEVLKMNSIDAIETHNGLNTEGMNERAVQVARMKRLPTIGGSDCHNVDQMGKAFTEFDEPVFTIDQLVEAIRKGKCRGMTRDD